MKKWESMKRRMAADPEYAAKLHADIVRRTQEWRKRHPERYQKLLREQAAKRKARRKADAAYADRIRAQKRANYAKRRVVLLEQYHERYQSDEAFRNRKRSCTARANEKFFAKLASDAKLYAAWRAKNRMRWARKAVAEGRLYRPLFCLRIPDWATKGQRVLDARSAYLAVNLTDEQRAYARELAIERKQRRAAR